MNFRLLRTRGASLIICLLVLLILSAVVSAFLQSMAIERMIAESHKTIFEAELAALAGVNAAVGQIHTGMGTNAFVTGLTRFGPFPVTVLGLTNLTDGSQLMPLISLPRLPFSSFPSPDWADELKKIPSVLADAKRSTDLNTSRAFLEATSDRSRYRAAWRVLTNEHGEESSRYAFLALDEMARANPFLHNGSGNRADDSDWYHGPGDIDLAHRDAPILTEAQARSFRNLSNIPHAPEILRQAFGSAAEFEAVKHLLSVHSNPSYDWIPASLTTTATPKYPLHELATNRSFGDTAAARAGFIAEKINALLTNFSTRDPSLRGQPAAVRRRYLERLTATMVDYIDDDSLPTFTLSGEPAGRDLFPLVTAIAERVVLTSLHTNTASATFESRFFVQLWNPYTSPITLTNTALQIANRPRVNFGQGILQTFSPYRQTNTETVTLRPNEFRVIGYPAVNQTFTAPPSTNVPYWGHGTSAFDTTDTEDQTTWIPFAFWVDEHLADMSRRSPVSPGPAHSGLTRSFKKFSAVGAPHYQVNFIPTQSSLPWRTVGDPRATFLCNYDWGTVLSADSSYARDVFWNGRQKDTAPRYQDFQRRWIHRDYVPRNPSEGRPAGNVSVSPTEVALGYSTADASAAIAVIRNGKMTSIGELGHLFDPVQADDNLQAPWGGTPSSPYVAAGGRTLRIGQPEFSTPDSHTWNTNGRRAIELIDVFTVNPTNAQGIPSVTGRINLNTATPAVLSAVLAGIRITSDPGIPPARLTNPSALAAEIIAHRPYTTLSDLHRVVPLFAQGSNYLPPFGIQYGGGTTNLLAVDRVREEAFGKFVPHVTIQSHTYRILAIGEALDRQGNPRGRAVVETVVHFEPKENGTVSPVICSQRFLR